MQNERVRPQPCVTINLPALVALRVRSSMTAAVSSSIPASDKDASADKAAAKGLKGVVAADTKICDVDGDEGKLIYRGYNIHELAKRSTFEEIGRASCRERVLWYV